MPVELFLLPVASMATHMGAEAETRGGRGWKAGGGGHMLGLAILLMSKLKAQEDGLACWQFICF